MVLHLMPIMEVGYIRKIADDDSGLEVGAVLSLVKGSAAPTGWEWFTPPEPIREALEPRLFCLCFDDSRSDQECPCPDECGETNKCLVRLLEAKGWRPPSA